MRKCSRERGAPCRVAKIVLALASAVGLAQAGCSDVQAERDLHGSASEGLVYVLADLDDLDRTDLWRARLSDGAVRPFMQTPERDETWPFWSVTAATLAVEISPTDVRRGGSQQIVLWSDGKERDLPGVSARREAWAAWAAAGSRLVYAFTNLRQPPTFNGIAVVDTEKGEQRILARGTRAHRYLRPELDPEGVRAVAQRIKPRGKANERRESRVWLLQPGATPRPLSDEDGYAMKARFTRDGELVVFTRQEVPDAPGDVILMRPDGTGARPFASTPETDDHTARASPVRDEIVFVSDRDGKHDLFITGLQDGEARNLTGHLDFEVSAPRWAPNGERIVVTASPYDPDADEERSRRVTRSTAHVLVVDREGQLLFETRGFSPDWMPPWR